MHRLATNQLVRRLAMAVVLVALIVAVVLQRTTIIEAIAELRTLSAWALALLGVLAVLDRVLRAEVIRSLLPMISLARAEVISDVGAAATKGIPLGGPLGTVLRWQIARERGVEAVGFLAMLVATGVAAAFTSWGLALVAAVADLPGRSLTGVDVAILAVSVTMLVGAVVFWALVLGTETVERWAVEQSSWICTRFVGLVPSLATADPEALIRDLWVALRRFAARPLPLMARTVLAQLNGVAILWVALVSLGGGSEPSVTAFARVFFVTHILGSMVPTPGGVGVMELGLTGALVAIGVPTPTALGAVLVYRFITFLLPIVVGTVLYGAWQRRRRGEQPAVVAGDGRSDVERVAESSKG